MVMEMYEFGRGEILERIFLQIGFEKDVKLLQYNYEMESKRKCYN